MSVVLRWILIYPNRAVETNLCTNACSVFLFSGLVKTGFKKKRRYLRIALFTVTFAHLHDNVFERGREAISGKNFRIARNCLTSTFKHIVMQIRKGNCEKGYCLQPDCQREAWCTTFHIKMRFDCLWVKFHFHMNGCAQGFALRKRWERQLGNGLTRLIWSTDWHNGSRVPSQDQLSLHDVQWPGAWPCVWWSGCYGVGLWTLSHWQQCRVWLVRCVVYPDFKELGYQNGKAIS